jgi:hypothetical protein
MKPQNTLQRKFYVKNGIYVLCSYKCPSPVSRGWLLSWV